MRPVAMSALSGAGHLPFTMPRCSRETLAGRPAVTIDIAIRNGGGRGRSAKPSRLSVTC
jgi:hypothetical protein